MWSDSAYRGWMSSKRLRFQSSIWRMTTGENIEEEEVGIMREFDSKTGTITAIPSTSGAKGGGLPK